MEQRQNSRIRQLAGCALGGIALTAGLALMTVSTATTAGAQQAHRTDRCESDWQKPSDDGVQADGMHHRKCDDDVTTTTECDHSDDSDNVTVTTTAAPTTTEAPATTTTTSEAPHSTTTAAPTTTAAAVTTTAAVKVLDETTVAPHATTTVAKAAAKQLAVTGQASGAMAAWGLGLVGLGFVTLRARLRLGRN